MLFVVVRTAFYIAKFIFYFIIINFRQKQKTPVFVQNKSYFLPIFTKCLNPLTN